MTLLVFFLGAIGAAIGSFLALAFDRLRRGKSIVSPRSHCLTCARSIRPVDNIPIVSWVLLGARCRYCKAFIPLHVVLCEVVGAAVGIFVATRVGS